MPLPHAPALLRLVLAGGRIGPRRALLEAHAFDADAVAAAGHAAWSAAGLDARQVQRLRGRDADTRAIEARTLRWLEGPGHHLVGWGDADYPPLLRHIASPPLALFVAGEPGRLWHPQLAIVGSRGASAGGIDNARLFARVLAEAGIAITSGLAAGIDAAAHAAALEAPGGLTLAVLGTGPDIAYPVAHTGLHAAIAERGAVISEHPPGTRPLRRHFPARNRIVAGMSLATLVVEAAERSGALISARMAAEYGREVFALPGSIHNPLARGCHQLLREGAQLAERPEDLLEALGLAAAQLAPGLRERLGNPISCPVEGDNGTRDDPQKLWRALGHDPIPMDLLVERTGLTVAELSPMLLALELQGRLSVEHGRYTRKSA